MLSRREQDVLTGVAACLVPDFPPLDTGAREHVLRDVSAFLVGQVDALPGVLRVPYRCALAAFDVAPVARHRRTFRRLPPAAQAAHLVWWTDAGGLATRNFVKLLRSCTLLAWFDHPLVTGRLLDTPARPEEAA
jgi:hypothetical protein